MTIATDMMTLVRGRHSVCKPKTILGLMLLLVAVYAPLRAQTPLPFIDPTPPSGTLYPDQVDQVVNPVSNKLYFPALPYVEVLNLATNAINYVNAGGTSGGSISNFAVDPVNNKVWGVAYGSGNSVLVIDGASDTAAAQLTIPGAPGSSGAIRTWAVATAPVQGLVFVGGETDTSDGTGQIFYLLAYDAKTYTLLGQIALPGRTMQVVVDPVQGYVYALTLGSYLQVSQISAQRSFWTSASYNASYKTQPVLNSSGQSFSGYGSIATHPVTGNVIVSYGDETETGYNIFSASTMGKTYSHSIPGFGTNLDNFIREMGVEINPVTNMAYFPEMALDNDNDDTASFDVLNMNTYATSTQTPDGDSGGHQQTASILDSTMNRLYIGDSRGGYSVPAEFSVYNATTYGYDYTNYVESGPYTYIFCGFALNPVTHRMYWMEQQGPTVPFDEASTSSTSKINVGSEPAGMAINPVTHMGYVANAGDGTVSVINTQTNTVVTTITVGTTPQSVAVNPTNNRVYVANYRSNSVSVINGATNSVMATVPVGAYPLKVAVNSVTGNAYAASSTGSSVTAINASETPTTIAVGSTPEDFAIDPVRNLIYVANAGGSTVSVINGGNNTVVATVATGSSPVSLAIDTANNVIYTANAGSNTVTVINGVDDTTGTLYGVGTNPRSVAFNALTRRLYVANSGSQNVTVIDASSNSVIATPGTGNGTQGLAVDQRSNHVFGANYTDGTVSVIEGAASWPELVNTNLGTDVGAITMDQTSGTAYVMNEGSNFITAIAEGTVPMPYTFAINNAADTKQVSNTNIYETTTSTPSFNVQVSTSFLAGAGYSKVTGGKNPTPTALYYAVDSAAGAWTPVANPSVSGGVATFATGPLPSLPPGLHTLYFFSGYGSEGGQQPGGPDSYNVSTGAGAFGNEPQLSQVVSTTFQVDPAPTSTTVTPATSTVTAGTNATFTATITPSAESAGNVMFTDTTGGTTYAVSTVPVTVGTNGNPSTAVLSNYDISYGSHVIKATFTSTQGFSGSFGTATVNGTFPDNTTTTVAAINPSTISPGAAVTLQAAVADTGNAEGGSGNGAPTSGTVSFSDTNNGTTISAGSAGFASAGVTTAFSYFPTGAGTHKITATFTPSNTMLYNSSSDTTGKTFTIGTTQTITFPQPTTPVTNGTTPVTLTATASSGLSVTYTVTSGPALVSGSTLTYTGVGTVVVTATQAGNGTYGSAPPVSVTIVVQDFAGSYSFPNTAVGNSSTLLVAVTFSSAVQLNQYAGQAFSVRTKGNANLDFTYSPGGTCTAHATYAAGASCTIAVVFTPIAPGERLGGVLVYDSSSSPNLVGKVYVSGLATGGLGVFSLGESAQPVTGLTTPSSSATDAAGDIYYTDQGTGNVGLYYPSSGINEVIASGINTPTGIAVDGMGNVFVAAYGSNQLLEIVGGYETPVAVGTVTSPDEGLAIDGEGNVYTSGPAITEFSQSSSGTWSQKTVASTGNSLPGVAVDAAGAVYTADFSTGRIYKIPAGTTVNASSTNYITDSNISSPRGVAVDANGNIYVALQSAQTVRKLLNVNGSYSASTVIQSGFSYNSLAIDGEGNLYSATNGGVVEIQRAPSIIADFPPTTVGNTSTVTLTVENDGNDVFSPGTVTYGNGTTFTGNLQGGYCYPGHNVVVAGTCTLTMVFSPTAGTVSSSQFSIAQSSPANNISVTVLGTGVKANQTITFPQPASPVVNGSAPVTLTATASSGLPVTYTVYSGPGVVTNGVLSFTGVGTIEVSALQAGNSGYNAAENATDYVVVTAAPTSYKAKETSVGSPVTASATITFTAAATLNATLASAIKVVTQGTTGLDFSYAAGGTCAVNTAYVSGQACTVNYTFSPIAPGLREGAIQLYNTSGTLVGTSYISGIGDAPLGLLSTGTQSVIATFSAPRSPFVDAAGNLYITEQYNESVLKYPLGTTPASTLAASLSGVSGLAVDGAGNVFFGASGQINEIKGGTGSAVAVATVPSPDNNLVIDGAGDIFVTSSGGGLYEIPAGATTATSVIAAGATVTGGTLGRTVGMTGDENGNLFLADYSNNRIYELVSGASTLTTLVNADGFLASPQGIGVDPAGNLYVANSSGTVYKYTSINGTYIASLVTGASATAGLFVAPNGDLYLISGGQVAHDKRTTAPTVTFPTTTQGSTSTPQAVAVENDGNALLQITSTSATANFTTNDSENTCTASTVLGSNGTCNLGIAFAPTTGGNLTGTATLASNSMGVAGTLLPVPLTGTAQLSQTITFSPSSPLVYSSGLTETLSATSSSNLAVTFTLVSGPATLSGTVLSFTGPGTVIVQANQAGNSTYAAATSVRASIFVNPAVQTISFTLPVSEVTFTSSVAPVALSATSSSGLPVSLEVNGPATLSGSVLTFTGPGYVTITATQPGNANYAAATSVTQAFGVDPQFDHATLSQGITGNVQTLTIAFPAATTLGSIKASVSPVNAGTFTILNGSSGGTCAIGTAYSAGAVCTVKVTFTPGSPGIVSGAIQVLDTSSVVQVTVPLLSLRYR